VPAPSQQLWVAGRIPTAAQFNDDIRDAINFFKTPPRAQATHNATISRPNRTSWSVIPWNTTVTETDGSSMHNPGSNAGQRLVAQSAGYYYCWCNLTWEDHTAQPFDGTRGCAIRKNSAGSAAGGELVGIDQRHCKTNAIGSHGASQQGCDGYVFLAVNDYIEAFAYDADNDTVGFPSTDVGCYLEPQTWSAQRFGMIWVSV